MPDDTPPPIHVALARATAQVAPVGKDEHNIEGGYAARSIDGVLDAVHGPLTAQGIVLLPCVEERHYEARQSNRGNVLHHVTVCVSWTLTGPAGDSLTLGPVYGEAMDSSDKATNKAMSAALKVALIQLFTLPVSGDDPDLHHPEATVPAREVLEDSATYLASITERLRVIHEATPGSDAYPPAWRASSLNGLPWYRDNGLTASELVAMQAVLEPLEVQLEETAVQEPEFDADVCDTCGHTLPGHEPGCAEEPF